MPTKHWEQLTFIADGLKEKLSPSHEADQKLVEQGLRLYRQSLVRLKDIDEDRVTAVVQDVNRADVVLDMNFFDMSSCSCPIEGICRHQLATFFSLYNEQGSVFEWIEDWKRQKSKLSNVTERFQLKRASDLLKAAQLTRSYDSWMNAFDESFEGVLRQNGPYKPYLIGDITRQFRSKLQNGAPYEREWKLLYELVSSFFLFLKWSEVGVRTNADKDVINRYYLLLLQSLYEDITDLVGKLSVQSMPFAFDDFIDGLRQDSQKLLEGHPHLAHDHLLLYRYLWTDLFKTNSWRIEEQKRLEGNEEDFSSSIALAHLFILNQKMEEAQKVLDPLPIEKLEFYLFWIQLFTYKKAWNELSALVEDFVNSLSPFMQQLYGYQNRMNFSRNAIKSIMEYCVQQKRTDLFEKALHSCLPYSFYHYEDFLFEKGDYKRWIELHMFIRSGMDLLSDDRIKLLQKQEPAVLIPLYHQTIQQNVDFKTRSNYKLAVRQLKKLRALYKKTKQESTWNYYFEQLLEQTKRLRAFQEECKKGKLIDA